MTYRVGLVGTGGIARAHAAACKAMGDVDLCAVCDISREALDRFGGEFGVEKRHVGLESMLKAESLDVAILCTWGVFHAEAAIAAARSGRVRAILCEKPFSSNAAEAEAMARAARESGVLLAEAFKFRHHPQHLKVDEILRSGGIGEVRAVRSTFHACCAPEQRRPEKNWRFNRAQGGGAIYDLGCYAIHHARFVFQAEPTRVFATAQQGIEVEEAASLLLEFPGSNTAQISVGFNLASSQYAEIYGSQGMVRVDAAWNNENQPVTFQVSTTNGAQESHRLPPANQFVLQLRHLLECLATGRPHRIPLEDSIGQMRVLDAVFESFRAHRPVDFVDGHGSAGALLNRDTSRHTGSKP
ncbi:MAG: Gfo/Idh/MocA family oxidoreductase [Planctomycetes bacterium]|nr:Gfo/Idh/MocA family oxidoreductase [Planctomycetota bacterium]